MKEYLIFVDGKLVHTTLNLLSHHMKLNYCIAHYGPIRTTEKQVWT